MNKSKFALPMILFCLLKTTYSFAQDHVTQAINNSFAASSNVIGSAAHSIAASGQVTSAALAIPLVSGAVILGAAGSASANAAANLDLPPIGSPLTVTNETVSVMPPNQALMPESAKPKLDNKQ